MTLSKAKIIQGPTAADNLSRESLQELHHFVKRLPYRPARTSPPPITGARPLTGLISERVVEPPLIFYASSSQRFTLLGQAWSMICVVVPQPVVPQLALVYLAISRCSGSAMPSSALETVFASLQPYHKMRTSSSRLESRVGRFIAPSKSVHVIPFTFMIDTSLEVQRRLCLFVRRHCRRLQH